jgi:hypothetical protein
MNIMKILIMHSTLVVELAFQQASHQCFNLNGNVLFPEKKFKWNIIHLMDTNS